MTCEYIKSNLHTHSTFCDGKNTPEENVLSAIKKGIKVLGFTSHSMYPFWTETYMQPEDFSVYCAEIRRLQEKYASQIKIRLGFEADFIPGVTLPKMENYADFKPDYLIGSIHFLFQREGLVAVDHKPEILQEGAKNHYKNDIRALIGDYFTLQKEMLERGDFALVGHPDLIRKFNEKWPFFSENEEWYKDELKEMAKAIAKKGIATEINSGAISRGYLSKPYPSEYFLSLLHDEGVPVAITADAHSAENLDCAFDQSIQLARKIGYSEIIYDIDTAGYKFCRI
ncbi:MAG: histidinol-phosphatase [Treponema sp.]|uniref:histidinol-phosphatase n=1 Tax=Treponema sp. TaxID=166 RepID=UPI0025DBB524|nr:histidinol-phosphatase [Treponema sp.]MBQ8678676.1 histidinol-phosphatase [Treponema sp.]